MCDSSDRGHKPQPAQLLSIMLNSGLGMFRTLAADHSYLRTMGLRRLLYATGAAGVLLLLVMCSWALMTGPRAMHRATTLNGHLKGIGCLVFSPDMATLASSSDDQTVKIWDVDSRSVRRTIRGYSTYIPAVAFSPDGKYLAVASNADEISTINKYGGIESGGGGKGGSRVKVYAAETGDLVVQLYGHVGSVSSLAFSPDGRLLVTAAETETDIKVWEVGNWTERVTIHARCPWANAVAFAPDGKLLAVAHMDGEVGLWDFATFKQKRVLKGHKGDATSVAFAPGGRLLASGGRDHKVVLWNASSGQEACRLPCSAEVVSVAFSPDGRLLAAGEYCGGLPSVYGSGDVRLWDVAHKRCRAILKGHSKGARSLAFSPDGQTLATGDEQGIIRLWDLREEM